MFHHLFRLTHPGGGYAYYGEGHHLPALFYLQFSFLSMVLAALAFLAILVVLLPSLHRKLPSLLVGLTSIFIGSVAGYGLIIPEWQVGFMELPHEALSYQPHHKAHLLQPVKPISMQVGLRIGLSGANFTLMHAARPNLTFYWDERVEFDTISGMSKQFIDSLHRGLPVAVLELQEQVVGCGESGFIWPVKLRLAGYYCSWLLAAAITLWAFTCLLLISLPIYGALSLMGTGVIMISVPVLYCILLGSSSGPVHHLRVAGQRMPLNYGPCLWVNLFGGIWATAVGAGLYFYHKRHPHSFFTDFDVDYDIYEGERRRTLILETEKKIDENRSRSLENLESIFYEDTRL